MLKGKGTGAVLGASLAALSLALTPVLAATQQQQKQRPRASRSIVSLTGGNFTPAVADPRLAAELARRGLQPGSFRFTPASASRDRSKAVRVAVRARTITPASAGRVTTASATPVTAITPTAYNLGVSVGWKRFALAGDVAKVKGGILPGGREAAEVGVSYGGSKFTGRVEVGADRSSGIQPRPIGDEGYSVGVGGSYRIARNLDVTGGVRYRIQRDRLEPLADQRRDSQAVYVGTAFRF